jgi:hypothetical protein
MNLWPGELVRSLRKEIDRIHRMNRRKRRNIKLS